MDEEKLIIQGEGTFPIIKPLVGYKKDIERVLEKFPYSQNVFLMMRFRDSNKELSDFIIEILNEGGLRGIRADHPEWNITNDVYNPIAVLYCCKYGIALFDEAEPHQVYNPNVIYELGMMHCQGKSCLILKHFSLPQVPFDLIKDLYMPYKGDLAVRTNIGKWMQQVTPLESIPSISKEEFAESELQQAALKSTSHDRETTVTSDDYIETSEFHWEVASKGRWNWKIKWVMTISNKSSRPVNICIQLLYLDSEGFALDDQVETTVYKLKPGESKNHGSDFTMVSDLAKRVQRVMATVSSLKKVQ